VHAERRLLEHQLVASRIVEHEGPAPRVHRPAHGFDHVAEHLLVIRGRAHRPADREHRGDLSGESRRAGGRHRRSIADEDGSLRHGRRATIALSPILASATKIVKQALAGPT
jgi:hypothetical protein